MELTDRSKLIVIGILTSSQDRFRFMLYCRIWLNPIVTAWRSQLLPHPHPPPLGPTRSEIGYIIITLLVALWARKRQSVMERDTFHQPYISVPQSIIPDDRNRPIWRSS